MQNNQKVPQSWQLFEFNKIAILRKNKYTPSLDEHLKCLELEHFEKETGCLNGYVDSAQQSSTKNVFKAGDVLFGKLRPYLKKFYRPNFDGVCSTEIWVLNGLEICKNEYLYLLIQTNKFNYICNVSTGTHMPRADWNFVENTPFLIPPLPEQEKIAEILGTWDVAIKKLSDLIEQKKLLKKGLMQKLLTGKTRLPGFSQPWKEVKLGEICKLETTTSKSAFIDENGKYYIIDMGAVSMEGTLISSKRTNTREDLLKINDIVMPKDDIGGGNIIGKTAIIKQESTYVLSDHVFKLKIHDSDAMFISYLINSFKYNKYMRRMSSGSAILGLSKKDVEKCLLNIPSDISEQQAIADVLSAADDEINLLNQKLEAIKEQKKGLMQQLLTGQIRVKVN